jgi:hypothetical protein
MSWTSPQASSFHPFFPNGKRIARWELISAGEKQTKRIGWPEFMRNTLTMLLTLFLAASLAAQESNSGAQASIPVSPATQQQLDDMNANTLDPEKPAKRDGGDQHGRFQNQGTRE